MPDFFRTRFGSLPSAVPAGLDVQIHKDLLTQALKNRGHKDSPNNTNGEQIIINLENDGEYDFHLTFQACKGQKIWFDRAHYCIRREGEEVQDREYNSVIYWWYKFVIGGVTVPAGTPPAPVQITNSAVNYSFQKPLAGGGLDIPDMVSAVEVTDSTNPAYGIDQSDIMNNLITDMKKLARTTWMLYYAKGSSPGWKIGPPPKS